MYLDYTKIKFDSMGRPEVPGLLLQTMSGTSIGFLDNVVDLKLTIKFSEPSEISFQIPAYNDGVVQSDLYRELRHIYDHKAIH